MKLSATNPGWLRSLAALAGLLAAMAGAPAALAAAEAAAPALPALSAAPAARAEHVLRYAFPVAETGFDPAKISDLYSRTITGQIFEALFFYDHLARPARVRPLTAAAAPEVSDDFKRYTFHLRPGIYFADDPAFKGARRELVAQDYVYSLQRFADPATKSSAWSEIEELGLLGLAEQRKRALDTRQAFDYGVALAGLKATGRYTLQLTLREARPRLPETLADSGLYGAVAREVAEFYGDRLAEHPVGTGAFRLASWRRSSQIVLERNPNYRLRHYEDEAEPNPDDVAGQALLARFKGRQIPMLDRVVISIIEEAQPRWLSFLNRQQDFIDRVPPEFVNTAMPGGKLAPNLAKQGIVGYRTVGPEGVLTVFNMEDPVVGGYTPDKVALRRAINLAVDIPREIAMGRRGQAIPAQSPLVPHTTGYDPAYRSEMGEYSPAKAKALLDLYGYVDKDGDGWRDLPDGSPLLLVRATQPDSAQRQLDELWQKNMNAIGLKIAFKFAKWPENLKASQAGKLMIWGVGSASSSLDGQGALLRLYGPASGGGNLARFKLPEFDALYNRLSSLPNGPERDALFLQAKRLATAYAPYKQHVHRVYTDMAQPWFVGYRRGLFWSRWWHMVDVDPALRPTE
jgi:ABC-type transport system substrate-binding protein